MRPLLVDQMAGHLDFVASFDISEAEKRVHSKITHEGFVQHYP